MIMIPPTIDDSNFAEKKVFSKLKFDKNPETKNWVVYHSLNYPVSVNKKDRKSFKYFGEADFVILIPNRGIINIEVKGWNRFSCNNGIWQIIKPDGTKESNKKSPLKQANDSKYNIRKYIELKLNKKFPQEWMVVFTQCPFGSIDDNIEHSKDNLVDADSFDSNFITRIIDLSKLLKSGGGVFEINNQEMNLLKNKIMRPNFEVFVKTPTILNDSEVEIHEFTKEQMDAINFLEEGKRILVTGSQGTGKSSIAEEVLKRESEKNNSKILFLNSNRLACEEIKFKLEKNKNKKKIDFYTFNQIMLNIINNINPQISKEIFKMEFIEKNNYLIKKSIEVLKNNIEINENYKYDLIVFDEIQNCYFYDQFYIFLNLILKNELTNGRYCFLGDFKYQNLVSKDIEVPDNKHPRNNLLDPELINLIRNVRNAKSISRNAPILSGLFKNFPYQISKSEHGKVFNSFSKTREEKIEQIRKIIQKLYKDGVKGHDIVILSNFRLNNKNNFISDINISDFYDYIIDLTDTNIRELNKNSSKLKGTNSIYFSTASAFQGLESKIVIYVDPLETSGATSQHYINLKPELLAFNAMGRANTILYILWDSRLKNYYDEKLEMIGNLSV